MLHYNHTNTATQLVKEIADNKGDSSDLSDAVISTIGKHHPRIVSVRPADVRAEIETLAKQIRAGSVS